MNKLGLALGGGAVLGAAHIGVLQALEERDLKPEFISGTSIGAFVASLYAFGFSVEKLKEIALELDWLDITSFKLSKMGILGNDRIGKLILDNLGKARIEESEIPLAIVSTDITNGEKIVLTEGPLFKAVMASTCLPGIFIPVEWDGRLLVDGVLSENIPISPLRKMGAEDVIAVDLTTNRDFKRPEDIIDVLSNTFDIGLNNMISKQIQDDRTVMIQPKLSAYNKADTRKTKDLIQEGYEEASRILHQKELEPGSQ
jgi:NTE family protein